MAVSAAPELEVALVRRLELHPQVAIRPEPFGALAYHYGNRRLIFLRHPDMVRVVSTLGHHETLADALDSCGVTASRWPSFVKALQSLEASEVIRER